jgi:hypothetical protein
LGLGGVEVPISVAEPVPGVTSAIRSRGLLFGIEVALSAALDDRGQLGADHQEGAKFISGRG